MAGKTYLNVNVLDAARERIRFVFDRFEVICVSYSGGKDSTVLLNLALEEARRRDRIIDVLFIDLEAQYRCTIETVEAVMLGDPRIRPWWICLPLNLRNAVSVFQPHWVCWDPKEQKYWVRPMPQHDCVISDPDELPWFRYRMEFEEFIVHWPFWLLERLGAQSYAGLVAIRSDESLNRYKAVAKRPDGRKRSAYIDEGGREIRWGTVLDEKDPRVVSFYPIYDWRTEDVWRYIHDSGARYNPIYDRMYLAGVPLSEQRICQPYGDDQRKGLDLWHKMEPETWTRILDRVVGVNYGARYARDKMLGYHRGLGLPPGHTWKSYTFFLLSTLPDVVRERYLSNFAVFLEWWMRHGYPSLEMIHDDETEAKKQQTKWPRLPSWRRLALAILKNDFNCKSLTIGPIKDVVSDVYDRVAAGEPVKVRKSVQPVYDYLREQYQRYLEGGIEAVTVDFVLPGQHQEVIEATRNRLKEKYADL